MLNDIFVTAWYYCGGYFAVVMAESNSKLLKAASGLVAFVATAIVLGLVLSPLILTSGCAGTGNRSSFVAPEWAKELGPYSIRGDLGSYKLKLLDPCLTVGTISYGDTVDVEVIVTLKDKEAIVKTPKDSRGEYEVIVFRGGDFTLLSHEIEERGKNWDNYYRIRKVIVVKN